MIEVLYPQSPPEPVGARTVRLCPDTPKVTHAERIANNYEAVKKWRQANRERYNKMSNDRYHRLKARA